MSLHHDDLLKQALHLAKLEEATEADFRRSVSTSYYALFHLLVNEATKLMLPDSVYDTLKYRFPRSFDHKNMKNVANQFSNLPTVPYGLNFGSHINESLASVADSFSQLQKERHDADYNLEVDFSKDKALNNYYISKESFNLWEQVSTTLQAQTFLIGLHDCRNINGRE